MKRMIDWVSARLPLRHFPINNGGVVKFLADGSVDWQIRSKLQVQGSHESSIQIRSDGEFDAEGRASEIFFSGNPSKFLQGHNVFGSDDIIALMSDVFTVLCNHLEIAPEPEDLRKIKEGDYPLIKVDINYSFELPHRRDVLSWLRAAEYKSKTRHGRPQMKGGTLYFGKNSRRWAIKAYSKGEEIEAPKHQLPEALLATQIPNWADNKLRIELVLMKKELAEIGLLNAKAMTPDVVKEIYNSYVRKIEMNQQIALSTEKEHDLPQRLRSTYILWKSGVDLRTTLSKATFYRHRKDLYEHGIDITLRQESLDQSNVIPLVRVLEAKPASIPTWAIQQNLVHRSAAAI